VLTLIGFANVRGDTTMKRRNSDSCTDRLRIKRNLLKVVFAFAGLLLLLFWPSALAASANFGQIQAARHLSLIAPSYTLSSQNIHSIFLEVARGGEKISAYIIGGGLLLLAIGLIVLKRRNKK